MTWAKIDSGLHLNPKIRMAGADAREVFIYIVLANAGQSADGTLAGHYANAAFLADALQRDEETIRNALKRCVTFRLLHVTDEEVSIVGWDSEWRTPKSTSRVQKHREKKRLQALDEDETLRNVTETLQGVSETHETPRERERAEEREREIAPKKRASQIPDSWQPNKKHIAKASEDRTDIAEAVESFRDHHQAKGSAMKSWDAAFNTWLRNAKKFADSRIVAICAESISKLDFVTAKASDFMSIKWQACFVALCELRTEYSDDADALVLMDRVESMVDGITLADLVNVDANPPMIERYSEIVREEASKRRLRLGLSGVLHELEKGASASEGLSMALEAIKRAEIGQDTDARPVGDMVTERVVLLIDMVERRAKGEECITGVSTGNEHRRQRCACPQFGGRGEPLL
jgi:hypothetical protein